MSYMDLPKAALDNKYSTNQKLCWRFAEFLVRHSINQLHGFSRKLNHFFQANRVEHQKLNQKPNNALRRRLVEFLVFNAAFG